MSRLYRDAHRELQRAFDSERLADRIEQRLVSDRLSPDQQQFVGTRDAFFLATCGEDGWPTCSYKGGDPGFVQVLDDRTLAFPSWDGNGMFLSLGNLVERDRVGLLFIDFESPRRLRIEGIAHVAPNDPLLARFASAQCVVRVTIERAYPNCSRYVHRMALIERSPHVPRRGEEPPVPEWKRSDWASDVLPRKRGGRDE